MSGKNTELKCGGLKLVLPNGDVHMYRIYKFSSELGRQFVLPSDCICAEITNR